MVDTKDLKSFGLYRLCGFESRFLYSSAVSNSEAAFFMSMCVGDGCSLMGSILVDCKIYLLYRALISSDDIV